jgi:hypothetical protein
VVVGLAIVLVVAAMVGWLRSAGEPLSAGSGAGRVVERTAVVEVRPVDDQGHLKPGFVVTRTVPGATCDRDSLRVRAIAHRCSAGDEFYDPCWTETDRPTDPAVVCLLEPWSTEVHRLLTAVLVPPEPETSFDSPWWVELSGGRRCRLATGARSAIGDNDEDVVDYSCGDPIRLGLLRGFDRTRPVWLARAVRYDDGRFKRAGFEPIVTAWF